MGSAWGGLNRRAKALLAASAVLQHGMQLTTCRTSKRLGGRRCCCEGWLLLACPGQALAAGVPLAATPAGWSPSHPTQPRMLSSLMSVCSVDPLPACPCAGTQTGWVLCSQAL